MDNHQGITHGALFSGSGGFELAAQMCGITSLWASEIEPFPVRVTMEQFPEMRHLGDIGMIKGTKIAPVDIISGGSPCQDMSIAGRRSGLSGERSALFMDYIRIVKEMRQKYGKPRFMVWENVPGAFSSNRGEDFRCVLEEIVRVKDPDANVPEPPKGKWNHNGIIMGDGYSVAWRVLDAQYWGVPQRRRRIFLVADFAGECAGKVLFEREGLQRNFTESRKERQAASAASESGAGEAVRRAGIALPIENHPQDSRVGISSDGKCQTLTGQMGTGGNNVPIVLETSTVGFHITQNPITLTEKAPCLSTGNPKTGQACVGIVKLPKCYGIGAKESCGMNSPNPNSGIYEAETSRTIDTHGGDPTCNQGGIVIIERSDPGGAEEQRSTFYAVQNFSEYRESEIASTLRARDCLGIPVDIVVANMNVVARRLTPLECCRLQGFPDGWADITPIEEPSAAELSFWAKLWADWWALVGRRKGAKMPKSESAIRRWLKSKPSDSELYKMWGNGIALPCVLYVFEGIALQIKSEGSPRNQ